MLTPTALSVIATILAAYVSTTSSIPQPLNLSTYAGIHPRLPLVIKARTAGGNCGNWYNAYRQRHAAIRSGQADPSQSRWAVLASNASGLADRLTSSLTVFFYALLTDRAFEYVWYGPHQLWEAYSSPWIDWRAPPRNLEMSPIVRTAAGVLPIASENHHWRQGNRSTLTLDYYVDNSAHVPKARKTKYKMITKLLSHGNLLALGMDYDVVIWTLNQGRMANAFRNPILGKRLQVLGLTREHAAPCIFNYLYVPSPAALAPFRRGSLLDTLLDPHNFVVGVQVRVGDWVYQGKGDVDGLGAFGQSQFECASQLTHELLAVTSPLYGRQGLPWMPRDNASDAAVQPLLEPWKQGSGSWWERATTFWRRSHISGGVGYTTPFKQISSDPSSGRVYWLLISDSQALRSMAAKRYGPRLLVSEGVVLDHVQEAPDHGQAGLDVAASELWLFGLASAHVVTERSAFGRLGALAGGTPSRLYGIANHNVSRDCRLTSPDSLNKVASWWVGVR